VCLVGYWTGYFTSRPALKRYVRSASGYYQAAKQLNVLARGDPEGLKQFADAMGIAQHHDAGE
jgi:alpha-mannosidase